MKVLAVLGVKGGAGKTTLALHWAIEPAMFGPVMLLDTDPQGTAVSWGSTREEPLPLIHKVAADRMGEVVENVREAEAGLCFIDTAPNAESAALAAASLAALVVIPTLASARDLEELASTVAIVRQAEARAVIVVNAIRSMDALADEARKILHSYELPICPTPIGYSSALAEALTDGHGVQERDPESKPAGDVMAAWSWVKQRI